MDQEQSQQKKIGGGERLTYGIGSAVALAPALATLGHMGSTGVVFGIIGGLGAAMFGPDAVAKAKEAFPALSPHAPLPAPGPARASTGNELLDRLSGRNYADDTNPSPVTTAILETTAQEAAQMQLGPDQAAQEGDRTLIIPHAPKFKEMSHLIGSDRLILCYTIDGPLYGTVLDLLSMAIVGKPGRGKTTALMYYVSMLLKNGAEVFIWDPHGTMGELALLNGKTLSDMPATAKVVYLDRKDDMVDSVPVLQQKLQERDDEYRKCVRAGQPFVKHPLLLLSDELPVLADYDEQVEAQYKKLNRERKTDGEDELEVPSLITIIRRIVLEARKWNCYFIGSGQSTDAQILPTRVTENLSSRIVFYSSDRRARMAGLEQEDVKKFLPILKRADPGTMVFDGSRFEAPMLGAIPEINAADMKAFLLGVESKAVEQLAEDVLQPVRPAVLTIERILDLYDTGKLSEVAMLNLIDRLPTVRADDGQEYGGAFENESATGKLAPEIIDFHARNVRRADPLTVQQKEQQVPASRPVASRNMAKYARPLELWNANPEARTSRKFALLLSTPGHPVSKDAAWKIIDEMDRLGLIQKKGQVS